MRLMLHIALFAALAMSASAQEKLQDKVKSIEGEVSKITVTTDKGTTVFEGEDAKQLLKRMQRSNQVMVNVDTDFDLPDLPPLPPRGKGMKHKVIVIDGDTILNGAGDEFLKLDMDSLHAKMKKFKFYFDGEDGCMAAPKMKMFKHQRGHMMRGHCCEPPPCCRESLCGDDDDEACTQKEVVIIKKDKDGKSTVETFTGKDAEKKMQELKKDGKPGEKAEKKVIIKKKDMKEKAADKERNE